MNILVLDDRHSRILDFTKRFAGNRFTIVRSYQDAIRALRVQPKFDLVSLDYDIADFEADNEVGYVGKKRTGLDVAVYIATMLPTHKLPPRVIVHTHNVQKAPIMQSVLEEAGIRTDYEPYEETK